MKTDAHLTYLDYFMAEFYAELPKSDTYKDAYEAIENRHFQIFERRRFKDYGVFRSALSRWLKQNR